MGSLQIVDFQGRGGAIQTAEPDAQASTNAYAVVTGSELDARVFRSIAYTLVAASDGVDWEVFGANAADYSDEVIVNAEATVTEGTADSYAVQQAPFAYYRVKIKSETTDNPGTATVRGVAK